MYQTATITGTRQLTIPADLYRKAGFTQGQKVIVSLEDRTLKIESAEDIVLRLAGSLPVPKSYRNLATDEIIEKTKRLYMNKRGKRI